MKYKLALAIKDHRGQTMTEGGEKLTLGIMLERACLAGGAPDAKADDKYKQFKLAQRVALGSALLNDPTEFSAEEVAMLKKLCAQVYTPVAYGAVVEMLENEQVTVTADAEPLPAEVAAIVGSPGGTD